MKTTIRRIHDREQRFYEGPLQTPCIEWPGKRHRNGYGQLGRKTAHRVAYECAHGPIPDGLHVLHRCDNPPCINPEHLFLGTHHDNMIDSMLKGRNPIMMRALQTHCVNGHPLDEANTYRRPDTGTRRCRACNALRSSSYKAHQKARMR